MKTLKLLACLLVTVAPTVYGVELPPDAEILSWQPTAQMKKDYPYYHSGYDRDGAPVHIVEYGKWNFRKAIEGGEETTKQLDMLITQMFTRWKIDGLAAPGGAGSVVIVDLEGFDLHQAGHFGVVQFLLSLFPKFSAVFANGGLKQLYGVNVNFLAQNIYDLGKGMLGPIANQLDIHGTNADKWRPILLKHIDPSQIPEWYGGSRSHKALKVYP